MASPLEKRPVKADPPGTRIAFIDPATGVLTPHGLRVMTNLWRRTGGFNDDLDGVLATTLLSQVSSLTAASNEEKVRRTLETALQQIQAQGVERVRALLEDNKKTSDTNYAQLLGGLGRPPQTRVIQFTQNDTWRLNPDTKCLSVFAVGGGGGGGGGATGSSGGGGGGGANYSSAFIEASLLPATVTVTVGAAGTAGSSGGGAGGNGGDSSFGGFVAALGGKGAGAGGTGGAANETYGGMFQGGSGAGGASGGSDGGVAPNDYPGAPGGGGGGLYAGTPSIGGSGGTGSGRSLFSEGGGGSGGIAGGAGGSNPVSQTLIGPGFGGGGGGATLSSSGVGGAGFNGAGGGGGGGNAAGGSGGQGRVWVVEYY
jgi:hypothetical protein